MSRNSSPFLTTGINPSLAPNFAVSSKATGLRGIDTYGYPMQEPQYTSGTNPEKAYFRGVSFPSFMYVQMLSPSPKLKILHRLRRFSPPSSLFLFSHFLICSFSWCSPGNPLQYGDSASTALDGDPALLSFLDDGQHSFGSHMGTLTSRYGSGETEGNILSDPYHHLLTRNLTGHSSWPSTFPCSNRPLTCSINNPPSRLNSPVAALKTTPPAQGIVMESACHGHGETKQQLTLASQRTDFHPQNTSNISKRVQPSKRKQFQCIFCDVEYTTKNAWMRHETELHESPKKWQCPDCKATFLNENLFTRHHKHNHSCKDCQHANKAKIELPRKTAWACGFCATVFQNWEKRCEHVSSHFVYGKIKDDWKFSNVITGLLTQKWVATAWQALLAEKHGTNAEDQPKFEWESKNPNCLDLQQDLEHGQGEHKSTEEMDQLVRTAYSLGTCETLSFCEDALQVLPGDSESM